MPTISKKNEIDKLLTRYINAYIDEISQQTLPLCMQPE